MAPLPTCDHCQRDFGSENWIKLNGKIYHSRCWYGLNTALKNTREPVGHLLCPDCDRPVRTGDGTVFREGFAVHVACTR